MHTATWPPIKSSPMMHEMREQLKGKSQPGQPTLSRKEANRTWREDILGIRSEEQKRADKAKKQQLTKQTRQHSLDEE